MGEQGANLRHYTPSEVVKRATIPTDVELTAVFTLITLPAISFSLVVRTLVLTTLITGIGMTLVLTLKFSSSPEHDLVVTEVEVVWLSVRGLLGDYTKIHTIRGEIMLR